MQPRPTGGVRGGSALPGSARGTEAQRWRPGLPLRPRRAWAFRGGRGLEQGRPSSAPCPTLRSWGRPSTQSPSAHILCNPKASHKTAHPSARRRPPAATDLPTKPQRASRSSPGPTASADTTTGDLRGKCWPKADVCFGAGYPLLLYSLPSFFLFPHSSLQWRAKHTLFA